MNNAKNNWIGTWLIRNKCYAVVMTHRDGVEFGGISFNGNLLPGYWKDGNSLISPDLDLVERKLEHDRWDIPECLRDVANRASQNES